MTLVILMWLGQPPAVSCFNVNVRPVCSNKRFVHDQKFNLGAIKDNRDITSVIVNRGSRRIGCTASSRWLSPSMTLTSGAETIIQDPVSSSAGAKRMLLRLLAKPVHQDDEHEWMQEVLATLERLFVPIHTVGFFSLAVKVCAWSMISKEPRISRDDSPIRERRAVCIMNCTEATFSR